MKRFKGFPLHYRIWWTLLIWRFKVFPWLKTPKPKLMIVGYGRHGKDTVCEYLETMGYSFISSSYALAEALYGILKDEYGYKSVDECYADRHNKRARWFEEIGKYNYPDRTALGRMIYSKNDIYCGIRRLAEFESLRDQGVFHHSIWVDAIQRQPPESRSSMDISVGDAEFILDNNNDFIQCTIPALKQMIKKIEARYV